jgi:hypothetical protein
MDVVSVCPLRVASILWQPQRGGVALTVVAKATFRLQQHEARLAQEQEYPNDDDNFWNDDPARSLSSPTDLVPFKARPDVMLVGHAFAPRNQPVRSLVARITIGDVDKAIEVTCDRTLGHDGQIREAARFSKMPLRYERAGGGPDTMNPVGVRSDARPDAYGGVALPNLLPAGAQINALADLFVPVGFGPIAPAWPSRWQKLGRHQARFAASPWNTSPLPEDLDPSYFNAAPEDQRPSEIRDNERLVLENLHPEQPRLVTNLPGLRPAAFAEMPGRAPQRLHMECDTLWIDTDRSLCTLTWRGQIVLETQGQQGRVVVAMEEGQKRMSWSDIQRIENGGPSKAPQSQEGTAIVDLGTVDAPPVSARDSGRSAFASMSSSATVKADTPVPFAPQPSGARPPEMPSQPRTMPHRPRSPMTLTDVNLSADLPFLRAELDAIEAARAAQQPQGALPFASPASDLGETSRVTPIPQGALPFAPSLPSEGGPASMARPPAELSSAGYPRPPAPSDALSTMYSRGAAPAPPPLPPPPIAAAPAPAPPAPVAPPPPAPVVAAVSESPWAGGGPRSGSDSGAYVPPYDPAIARGGSPLAPLAPPAPPPPSPSPGAVPSVIIAAATVGGALAASNAAAASEVKPPAAISPQPRPVRTFHSKEMVDLLWFDPTIAPKLRDYARYKEILAEVQPKPKPVSFDSDPFEEVLREEEPEEIKARRDIFAVITRGDPIDAEGVGESMAEAVSDDGTFVPPIVLLSGELSFIFDELAQLKAMVAATSPFTQSDKKLKETLDTVNEILQTPWIQGSTGVAEGLVGRIKEAFAQGNRTLPPSYLDTHTERMLLEQRAFQKRTVFGEPHLRTLLSPLGVQAAIPTYLPESLATKLPMVLRMRVRLLAEAHLPQDQYETYQASLKAVAIGRVSPLPGRR